MSLLCWKEVLRSAVLVRPLGGIWVGGVVVVGAVAEGVVGRKFCHVKISTKSTPESVESQLPLTA